MSEAKKHEANKTQVGGQHYKKMPIEHWDLVAANDLDYFQGQITKYVMRHRGKNGLQDLEKAKHFLEKYIEVERMKQRGESISVTIVEPRAKCCGSCVRWGVVPTGEALPMAVEMPGKKFCPKLRCLTGEAEMSECQFFEAR